jgi:hypothetical protein
MSTECKVPMCGNPVFAAGVCRKHYEQERLATASPCSISGCAKKAYRGVLCITHYRLAKLANYPLCTVPNCGAPQKNLTLGLCGKHEFRVRTHAALESPRAADWGAREAHPLYSIWTWHKRKGAAGMCLEWRSNFWAFVAAVKERPDGATLRRLRLKYPLGPDNWEWRESHSNADPAKYQRDWRKRNPDLAKNSDLKRSYGITLAQYEAMLAAQGGKCAICRGPERTRDKDGGPRRMPVDHDHNTGKVRGLICTHCNRALGMFRDSVEILKAAIEYVERNY